MIKANMRRTDAVMKALEMIQGWKDEDKGVPVISVARITALHEILTEEDGCILNSYRTGGIATLEERTKRYQDIYAEPHEIASKLEELVEQTNLEARRRWRSMKNSEVADFAAKFMFNFIKIHPFTDGNGRTGRVLVAYLLLGITGNFRPFVFLKEAGQEMSRLDYISAFGSAEKLGQAVKHSLVAMGF